MWWRARDGKFSALQVAPHLAMIFMTRLTTGTQRRRAAEAYAFDWPP